MVVGRAFHWTNGATRFYRHAAMLFTTGHLFLGLRGVEFGIQIFWHFRENCRFCILGQFPFPTILQNSGLHTENFDLFTYILKNKALFKLVQTFFNQFSQLDVIALSGNPEYQWDIYPLLLDQDSLEGSHRLLQIRIQINPLPHKFIWSITE